MAEENKDSLFEKAQEQLRQLTGLGLKIAIIVLFAVSAWRLAWSNFSLDLSNFDFSDLLAMILALFAIAMSVAFYFKSTDSSNKFYDNSYNFTQKISEVLGRIEERFGEQLRHLGEGSEKIQSSFDNFAKSPKEIEEDTKETEGKIKKKEGEQQKEIQRLESANESYRQMIDDLTQKAELPEPDKYEFYKKLSELDTEKKTAQTRIRELEEDRDRLKQELIVSESLVPSNDNTTAQLIDFLFHNPDLVNLIQNRMPISPTRQKSQRILSHYPKRVQEQFQEYNLMGADGRLTTIGVVELQERVFRR